MGRRALGGVGGFGGQGSGGRKLCVWDSVAAVLLNSGFPL